MEVQHPVDRAIVQCWASGEAADMSEFVRLHRAEVPTAEVYPIERRLLDPANTDDLSAASEFSPTVEASWPDPDTLEDRPALSDPQL